MKPSEMGKLVLVKAVLHKTKGFPADHRRGEWLHLSFEPRPLATPRPGWLVGIRALPTGSVEPGGYDEPPCFHGSGSICAYAVVYWPTMAPVYVLPSDMTFDESAKPWPPNGSARERQRLREFVKRYPNQFPRDAKGHFISGG
jgi:hypothetical protein